ncbi:MAG: glycosyltransferase family 9 protein, partial [Chthoniobacter sp.]
PFVRKSLIRALSRPVRASQGKRREVKIAIFKPDRFGDLILASGAIQYFTKRYGPESCALLVADFAVELAEKLFPGALVIGIPHAHNDLLRGVIPNLWKLRPMLARYAFEKVICLRHQRSLYEELLLGRLLARESFGLRNTVDYMLPCDVETYVFPLTRSCSYPTDAPPASCLELEAHRLTVMAAENHEVTLEEVLPRLEIAPAEANFASAVIVSPFGSSDIRTYPLPLVVEVMRLIQQQSDCRFALCGEGKDANRLAELHHLAESAGVREVSIHTPESFLDFARIVAAARGAISVDTSTAHLATALDKPAAVIIGGGTYGRVGPWRRSERQIWITQPVPCFYCLWDCFQPKPFCITEVSPATVAQAMIERLP